VVRWLGLDVRVRNGLEHPCKREPIPTPGVHRGVRYSCEGRRNLTATAEGRVLHGARTRCLHTSIPGSGGEPFGPVWALRLYMLEFLQTP